MRQLAGLAVALLLVAADSKDTKDSKDAGKKAAETLTGVWKVSSLLVSGNEFEDAKGSKFTFKGDKLTRQAENGDEIYTFKLDASKMPAEVDFVPDQGDNKGKTLKGIYQLKDGVLKICLTLMPDAKRPKDFASKDGEDAILITLKQDKS
jgi:uncharacterized protein (TIGR03067 family)